MSDFRLPQQYDVVMCLFSSIGYLKTVDRVLRAFVCFRQHLLQGGLVVVEPWLDSQRLSRNVGTTDDVCVTAFRSAGLQADYDPKGLTNRGLYIAHIT